MSSRGGMATGCPGALRPGSARCNAPGRWPDSKHEAVVVEVAGEPCGGHAGRGAGFVARLPGRAAMKHQRTEDDGQDQAKDHGRYPSCRRLPKRVPTRLLDSTRGPVRVLAPPTDVAAKSPQGCVSPVDPMECAVRDAAAAVRWRHVPLSGKALLAARNAGRLAKPFQKFHQLAP